MTHFHIYDWTHALIQLLGHACFLEPSDIDIADHMTFYVVFSQSYTWYVYCFSCASPSIFCTKRTKGRIVVFWTVYGIQYTVFRIRYTKRSLGSNTIIISVHGRKTFYIDTDQEKSNVSYLKCFEQICVKTYYSTVQELPLLLAFCRCFRKLTESLGNNARSSCSASAGHFEATILKCIE